MNDRLLWVIASVVVGTACVVLYAHRTGCLPNDSYEGANILGGDEGRRSKIPAGWRMPPPIGTDPDYEGPSPSAPMKLSPYAMSTSKRVRRRQLARDRGDRGMDAAMSAYIRDIPGNIAYLGTGLDDRFVAVEDRIQSVDTEEFAGDDAAAVALRLQERGFSFVLASQRYPEPTPWMQPDAAGIRVRLRDGLPTSHFHPVLFGRAHILYRIAPPMDFSAADQRHITSWVRQRLSGEEPGPLGIERSTDSVGRREHRVIISFRAHYQRRTMGRRVMSESESGASLEEALSNTVQQIQRNWRESRALVMDQYRVELPSDLGEALGEMELEIEVVDRMCQILDRYEERLVWQFELGLEGMYLMRRDQFHYMSPATPIHRASGRNFRGERGMLEAFLEWNDLEEDAWQTRARAPGPNGRYLHDFGRFETHHWLEERAGGEVVELYRAVPLVTVHDVTPAAITRALRLGAMWLVNNQLEDGQFRYRYKPLEERPSRRWISGNNIVRHALNPYTLLLVNRVERDQRLVDAARRGIRYTLDHLRHEGDRCYVWHQDVPAPYENAKMGTVAVTILSILAMADVMDIDEYESDLRCLAEELLYVQDRNGHFRQYDVPEDHGYYGCENSIFPGEMLLALARMYAYSRDDRYRDAFERGFNFYRQWWAENVDNSTQDGVYNEEDRMNLVGFVPWNVMALNEMHRMTNEEQYADFAFELQDWMDDTFFYTPARTPYPDYLGSYYKHHWETPAINSNGYTEGAAAAYALALRTGRDIERRREILLLGVRFALQIQYEGYATTYYLPDPQTAMGGFRYNLNFSRSRNDYSYHAMSALAQAYEFLRQEDYPAQTPLPLPRTLSEAEGEPAPSDVSGDPEADADAGLDGGVSTNGDAAPVTPPSSDAGSPPQP